MPTKTNMMTKNYWLAPILLLQLGFTWGTGYSIARYVTTHGVSPIGYSFWQSLGPAIILFVVTLFTRQKIPLSWRYCRYYFICGLAGVALPNTNMYYAASHLPAGLLAVVVNTVPILAYVMALLSRLESFQWLRFIAVIMAFAGIMLIVGPGNSLPSPAMAPWVLYSLLTPFFFAFASIYISRHSPSASSTLTLAAGTLIFSTFIMLPLTFSMGDFYLFYLPFDTAEWLVLLEMFLSSAGYILFYKLIKLAGPVYFSFVDTIVTITGLIWGYTMFDERLNHWTWLAVLLIICSVIMITKRHKPVLE